MTLPAPQQPRGEQAALPPGPVASLPAPRGCSRPGGGVDAFPLQKLGTREESRQIRVVSSLPAGRLAQLQKKKGVHSPHRGCAVKRGAVRVQNPQRIEEQTEHQRPELPRGSRGEGQRGEAVAQSTVTLPQQWGAGEGQRDLLLRGSSSAASPGWWGDRGRLYQIPHPWGGRGVPRPSTTCFG